MNALIAEAKKVCGDFELRKNEWADETYSAGEVSATIQTEAGNIYTGICIDLACGIGFCAEASAIAEMLKHRETHIISVVAVSGDRILPPCGRCREMLAQVDSRNLDCKVILDDTNAVLLQELLPSHWLEAN